MGLIALVSFPGPAFPQSSNPREISFENSRRFGLVLVKVEVNGRSAVLIVDTASNHTIISSELADAPARNLDNVVATSRAVPALPVREFLPGPR